MGYSAFFSPDLGNYPIVCVHEKLTGEPCPSCGLSHSFSLILQGRFKEATDWNNYAIRIFLFFFLQLILRGIFAAVYLRATVTRARNAIVQTDIAITLTLFLAAFIPFIRFIFMLFSGTF